MKKKLFSIILILFLLVVPMVVFSACGKDEEVESNEESIMETYLEFDMSHTINIMYGSTFKLDDIVKPYYKNSQGKRGESVKASDLSGITYKVYLKDNMGEYSEVSDLTQVLQVGEYYVDVSCNEGKGTIYFNVVEATVPEEDIPVLQMSSFIYGQVVPSATINYDYSKYELQSVEYLYIDYKDVPLLDGDRESLSVYSWFNPSENDDYSFADDKTLFDRNYMVAMVSFKNYETIFTNPVVFNFTKATLNVSYDLVSNIAYSDEYKTFSDVNPYNLFVFDENNKRYLNATIDLFDEYGEKTGEASIDYLEFKIVNVDNIVIENDTNNIILEFYTNSNYINSLQKEVTVLFGERLELDLTAFKNLTYCWNGIEYVIGETTYSNYPYCYEIVEDESNTITASEIGEFTVKIKPDSYHVWSDKTSEIKTFTWKIVPVEIEVPTFYDYYIYDGIERSVLNSFTSDIYEVSGKTSATNAGNYTITLELKDSTNYT